MLKADTPTTLADRLREEGRSQRWLAGRTGIAYTTLGRIARGERLPDVVEAQAIVCALGRDISAIAELWELESATAEAA